MKKALSILALGLLAGGPAHAADTYIGAALGVSAWEDKADDVASDAAAGSGSNTLVKQEADSGAVRVFVGSWFNDNVGVEGGYVYLGESKFDVTFLNFGFTADGKQQSQAAYLDLHLGGKIIDSLRLYGKLGAYYADSKATLGVSGFSTNGSANNVGAHVGVGVDYAVLEHLVIKGTLEYFSQVGDEDKTFGKFDVLLLTAGVAYRF